MTRRVTTTHSTDAHDGTKELLTRGAAHAAGRHRGNHAHPARKTDRVSGPAPIHRARDPRPTMPKM